MIRVGSSSEIHLTLQIFIVFCQTFQSSEGRGRPRGPVGSGGLTEDYVDLDNYDYWNQGSIPPYIWVIAGMVTILSLGIALCSECCPGEGVIPSLKSRILRPCTRTLEAEKTTADPRQLRMLSISSDEFVVTFKG
ncbi:uncharacterized protein LOC111716504 [Eurytemora carolleeae]|uniref:uncharacterized protein LOC111716504 n=1 Tax=Eurytemora carolleeae TaxID=1294199 RepID=UPI000C768C5C|nr:uncharacterized protein LOC111716504 [Eurytemora carolleeae]|eukprot:XP_023347748.1 uncharacterized protein LOC111716504 [Eurytemora affinis]